MELAAEADVVFYSRSWAEVSLGRRALSFPPERAGRQSGSGERGKLHAANQGRTTNQSRGHTSPEHCLRAEAASSKAGVAHPSVLAP